MSQCSPVTRVVWTCTLKKFRITLFKWYWHNVTTVSLKQNASSELQLNSATTAPISVKRHLLFHRHLLSLLDLCATWEWKLIKKWLCENHTCLELSNTVTSGRSRPVIKCVVCETHQEEVKNFYVNGSLPIANEIAVYNSDRPKLYSDRTFAFQNSWSSCWHWQERETVEFEFWSTPLAFVP